ncbi:serine/threonine-protein phosphatase 7 long form homolog [Salvia hispanica]|uniref:serine/threonine-protein phosphatase 7 long form homolog n=1 Tax=Salvia hispanica TaxID=49212 RepID=UPI002009AC45|nr:serine/threonine-protein phosphatase 7 long form homolog [Salvia hispanica]
MIDGNPADDAPLSPETMYILNSVPDSAVLKTRRPENSQKVSFNGVLDNLPDIDYDTTKDPLNILIQELHVKYDNAIKLSTANSMWSWCDKPKNIDHYLITALIERWRPETHTFHFPVGEATVTLEDVEVLWGLKVDGNPVTGHIPTKSPEYWKEHSLNYLGICPSNNEIKEKVWKSTTLSKQLRIELGDEEEDYIYVKRARVYCLLLLGGLMIPNATGNKISFFYLQFLVDPERCAQYSMGGATLAALYHNLCEAACGRRTEVGGACTLLQVWAWERISSIRPTLTSPPDHADYKPLASVWTGPSSYTKAPQHCVELYRDQFSRMHANQFIWRPYVMRDLSAVCVEGRPIWASMTCLICWNMVEPHMPHRVLRQLDPHNPSSSLKIGST